MFKKRLMTTVRKIGFAFLMILCSVAFLAIIFGAVSINGQVTNTVINILVGIIGVILGLVLLFVIISSVWRYLNWQFFQPYREWKNRGRQNDGKCN